MKKLSVIVVVLFLGILTVHAQLTVKGIDEARIKIQWMSLEEAVEKSADQPRKILVDVYTTWCSWCDKMEGSTFNDPKIAQYINDHFYPVKFDAEQKEAIEFKEKSYGFSQNGKRGYHDLAKELMGGRFSFPTVIFLDEDQNLIQCVVGYKSPTQFQEISTYFADDHYRKVPWSTFQEMYRRQVLMEKR